MAKEKKQHGTRIRETREDRIFNAVNLIFWIVVLFIVLLSLIHI